MADNVDNLFKRFVDFHGFWGLIPLLTTNVYISILADEGQTWIGCFSDLPSSPQQDTERRIPATTHACALPPLGSHVNQT